MEKIFIQWDCQNKKKKVQLPIWGRQKFEFTRKKIIRDQTCPFLLLLFRVLFVLFVTLFYYSARQMVRITNSLYHEAYEYIKNDSLEGNCIVFVAADVDSICAVRIFQVLI